MLTLTCLLGSHLALAQEFNYVEPEELLRQIEAKADIVLLDAQPAKIGWYRWMELGYPVEKGKSQEGEAP